MGSECGSTEITVNGTRGAMAYDGAWGGVNIAEKRLLCFKCTDKLLSFLAPEPKKEGDENG